MLHDALTMTSTIITISKGMQITIPASIREELGLDVGNRLELEEKKGKITLKAIGDDLENVFEQTKHLKAKVHLTAKEMDDFNEKMFR